MTFNMLSIVMTFAGCVLGLRFLFASSSLLDEWGLDATAGSVVMSRRLGALYLGLAMMFFFGRTAAPSPLRAAVCLGMAGASGLLACLGLFELRAGRVRSRIAIPSVVEIVIAGCFVWVWLNGR